MTTPPDKPEQLDAASSACLELTRAWVLNILVGYGLSIAATSLILRAFAPINLMVDPERLRLLTLGGLFILFIVARAFLRRYSSRELLSDPSTRVARFLNAHVGSAVIGWFAMPLGLVYGLGVDPSLRGLAPFWVASIVVGVLAYPRAIELNDFDEPPHSETSK